ncbi:diacylglycerol kinase family lipid kinase [candidate division WOR-3 bacterium]|nr:diacylglycerol kinase family lipid kinase [candidate division WOR-3 bacterium]
MRRVVSIINPVAGKARGAKLRAKGLESLMRTFPESTFLYTNGPGHATELARDAKDAELMVVVGGDGTIREVICGLVSATGPLDHSTTGSRPLLAVIPVGSCNDLPRNVGIPADVAEACRVARAGDTRPIDVIRVEMSDHGNTQQTYFANAAGFGFDAQVTTEAQKSKHLRGMLLYLVAIVRTLSHLKCPLVRIRAGDFSADQRVLMVAAANGRYYGGGLKVAPDALPDDGLLDVCIGWEMGWWSTLKKLPRFVAGTHVALKEVKMLRGPELELEFLEPVQVELDGDVLSPQPFRRFRLTVLPRAINIRVD